MRFSSVCYAILQTIFLWAVLLGCKEHYIGRGTSTEFLIDSYLEQPIFHLDTYNEESIPFLLLLSKSGKMVSISSNSQRYKELVAHYGDGGFDLRRIPPGNEVYAEPLAIRCEVVVRVDGGDTLWRDVGDSVELEFESFAPILQRLRAGNAKRVYPERTKRLLRDVTKADLTLVNARSDIAIYPLAPYLFCGVYRITIGAAGSTPQVLTSKSF